MGRHFSARTLHSDPPPLGDASVIALRECAASCAANPDGDCGGDSEPKKRLARGRLFRHSLTHRASKRLSDFLGSLLGLMLLAPLMGCLRVSVRATSAGPGLYWSWRVGRGGRLFLMPKFRTMIVGAPVAPREGLTNANALVTPLGLFLRRSSLDELPQLWSVLVGDMSLIGPRPLLASDPGSKARELFPAALRVKPGLSGLAQTKGRNHLGPRVKARYDAFYARKSCFVVDAKLVLRTLQILMFRAGGGVL